MPGNLATASVSPTATVLPKMLCTSFVEMQSFPVLSTTYRDGTFERSLITDGVNAPRPARIWQLAWRLTVTQLNALRTFWETTVEGGTKPFYYYDPNQPLSGHQIGSNFDATGVSTQGRIVVFFRGSWSEQTTLGRVNVGQLFLVEVA